MAEQDCGEGEENDGCNLWSTAAWSVIRAVCGVVAYPQTFNCPDITVEVIGNHSSRLPSMQLIVNISFDTEAIPRLNPQQREQAIGRLHAGQPARVIANDFNCNVRTIERLRIRYNAKNSTNDRPRSGRTVTS
jgi:hypothetical protein